jgi:multiple sugar transport system substrate-binding protein
VRVVGEQPPAAARPAPAPRRRIWRPRRPSRSPAAPPYARQIDIRWYCCAGAATHPSRWPSRRRSSGVQRVPRQDPRDVRGGAVRRCERRPLLTQIGSGAGPDIVGPVGIGGANAFHGQWLDLAPLIQKTNYDLSGYPQDAVNIYKLDEGQVGIPFAVYPSALFYKKGLFDEAGLKEPPHKYGDQYQMPDGTMALELRHHPSSPSC